MAGQTYSCRFSRAWAKLLHAFASLGSCVTACSYRSAARAQRPCRKSLFPCCQHPALQQCHSSISHLPSPSLVFPPLPTSLYSPNPAGSTSTLSRWEQDLLERVREPGLEVVKLIDSGDTHLIPQRHGCSVMWKCPEARSSIAEGSVSLGLVAHHFDEARGPTEASPPLRTSTWRLTLSHSLPIHTHTHTQPHKVRVSDRRNEECPWETGDLGRASSDADPPGKLLTRMSTPSLPCPRTRQRLANPSNTRHHHRRGFCHSTSPPLDNDNTTHAYNG